jgi:hypothetical protein
MILLFESGVLDLCLVFWTLYIGVLYLLGWHTSFRSSSCLRFIGDMVLTLFLQVTLFNFSHSLFLEEMGGLRRVAHHHSTLVLCCTVSR